MVPPEPKSPRVSDPGAAICRDLEKGRDLAARLGALLREGAGAAGEVEEVADEVLMVFSRVLSALDSAESPGPCRAAAASSLCSDGVKGETSTGKRKARTAGNSRGGQRRKPHSYAWTVTSATVNDGHTWRKYGQKEIHSAKFPRSYFRCTHKHDQGCLATRQVQKSEDDPSTFLITYMGHHTCMNAGKSVQPGGRGDSGESFLISFGGPLSTVAATATATATATAGGGGGSPLLLSKEECDDDTLSNLSRNDSSSKYLTLPGPAAPMAAAAASDTGEATSSGLLSSCVDMDLGVESFPSFDEVFNLHHGDFDFDFP